MTTDLADCSQLLGGQRLLEFAVIRAASWAQHRIAGGSVVYGKLLLLQLLPSRHIRSTDFRQHLGCIRRRLLEYPQR